MAITLAVMGLILLPVMGAWMLKWGREAFRVAGVPRQAQPSSLELIALLLGAVFVVSLGSAIVASVLMHQLGTLLGLAAFIAFAAVAVVGPKGAFAWIFRRVDMDVRANALNEAPSALGGRRAEAR